MKERTKESTAQFKKDNMKFLFYISTKGQLEYLTENKKGYRRYLHEMDFGARRKSSVKNSAN